MDMKENGSRIHANIPLIAKNAMNGHPAVVAGAR